MLKNKTCPSSPLSSFSFLYSAQTETSFETAPLLPVLRPSVAISFLIPFSLFQPLLCAVLWCRSKGWEISARQEGKKQLPTCAQANSRQYLHGMAGCFYPTAVNLDSSDGSAVNSWLPRSLLPPLQGPGEFTVPATSQQSLCYCISAADRCPCQQS